MADVNDLTHEPESYTDLPMQPTGSGPADLEVAFEQMRLAEDDSTDPHGSAETLTVDETIPTEQTPGAVESAAHPS